MKILYFECNMGAAGDMLMAALLELHKNPGEFLARLNNIGIPGVKVSAEKCIKRGISGTHVNVKINGQDEYLHNMNLDLNRDCNHAHHSHSGLDDTRHLIGHLNVSDSVKSNAIEVYNLLAEAESKAHGEPVSQIHFHEVGQMDAIADIIGACMLIEDLKSDKGVDKIICSPINTGSGHVRCSHGILPVPGPATAEILKGVPIYSGEIKSELCTPTGAALLKFFSAEFCSMPEMTVEEIGYGMGTKDFVEANCLRVFLGEAGGICDMVSELVCNLDDMTPEAIAFAQELLMAEGALDVYTAAIGMKKGRPGISLTCMCRTSDKNKMLALIFKHTTTLGLREYTSRRYTLTKKQSNVETPYGNIRVKTSTGYGTSKSKPEFDDIAQIAKNNNISIQEVLALLQNP